MWDPRCEKTWFKKGQFSPNRKPIGSERLSKDGYQEIKIADFQKNKNWKAKHLILWEWHNGLVPKGHCVIFLDGDKQNITIENLALISQRENSVLNKKDLRSSVPEVTQAYVNVTKLTLAINDRTRKKGKPTMKCSECQYLSFWKGNGNPDRYYCDHKEAAAAVNAGSRLVCRCDRHSSELKTKFSPRWCPLRKQEREVEG